MTGDLIRSILFQSTGRQNWTAHKATLEVVCRSTNFEIGIQLWSLCAIGAFTVTPLSQISLRGFGILFTAGYV